MVGHHGAQVLGEMGILKDVEFLQVFGGMPARGEQKMPLQEGAALFQDPFYPR
jgi:hypothetical protein